MPDYKIAAGFQNAKLIQLDDKGNPLIDIPCFAWPKDRVIDTSDLALDATIVCGDWSSFSATWELRPRNRKEWRRYQKFFWYFMGSRFTPKIQHNIDRKKARMIRKYIKHLEFDLSWEAPDVY